MFHCRKVCVRKNSNRKMLEDEKRKTVSICAILLNAHRSTVNCEFKSHTHNLHCRLGFVSSAKREEEGLKKPKVESRK